MSGPELSSLPLRDYDQLPAAALAQRMRSLSADEVGVLLAYERAHAYRPGVLELMQARLTELDRGAGPAGGSEQAGPD